MDSKPTLWASVLAATGASLCCVVPLALVSFRVGGAWLATLTRLEPLRPVFVVLTLAVPGMTCAACPITVKKALTRVDGVTRVEVDYDRRHAVVRFDEAKADVAGLTRATVDAGYPSTLRESAK